MDFHILIVISCVFLASLFSLLFINKFFRRKTFEEIIAEKKAMNEKIFSQNKATAKKPKKVQQLKKETKREKKQRQKEQSKENTEQEDSDVQSEPTSAEEEPRGLSKVHVEFEPEPEVITPNPETTRRASNALKESNNANNANPNQKQKGKKDKKTPKAGILLNKNEPPAVKANVTAVEQLNHFEAKPPKDVVELKKVEKDEKPHQQNKKDKNAKKEKQNNAEKTQAAVAAAAVAPQATTEQVAEVVPVVQVVKEIKHQDDKARLNSPKNQQNSTSNGHKTKQNKKQNKDKADAKELLSALEKLSETDSISVSFLMCLFRRAELNRSEIQILIDYLLNRQQDTPSSHSEWSDDICQKLKRQLEEKERLLTEQQEASMGLQAKLRELRAEVNAERAQINATAKAYTEKIHAKEQEISNLSQELQASNDKLTAERQQFQAKLVREKQAGTQELLAQLQLIQSELKHKDLRINELNCIANTSHQALEELQQKNDVIQNQAQQIQELEQQRDELEQLSNNRVFELEQLKTLEAENSEYKVELCNLQNALESANKDVAQLSADLENAKTEHNAIRDEELNEKQQRIQLLEAENASLTQQLAGNSSKTEQQLQEQSSLLATLDSLKGTLAAREKQLAEVSDSNAALLAEVSRAEANSRQQTLQQAELQSRVEKLSAEVALKTQQLEDSELNVQLKLMQQLDEQLEKNDDLRKKNWKLVEALQNAEATIKESRISENLVQEKPLLIATQKSTASSDPATDQKQVRDLFQHLYPEAVRACAATALSTSFDQWVEQVLATHIKQVLAKSNASTISKSTQSNSSVNHNSTPNPHNTTNNNGDTATSNSRLSNASSEGISDTADVQKLYTENAQLRTQVDELTKLVKKTSNTLSELEGRAREQDEVWRSIVHAKDQQIHVLQHSNGGEAHLIGHAS